MRGLVGLVCMMVAGAAVAQEQRSGSEVRRVLEMPAHRSLMALVDTPETELAPFATDGCSGGMSWSWRVVADIFPDFAQAQGAVPPWETCCIIHDEAYHTAGGATQADASFDARLAADEALRVCVATPEADEVARLAEQYSVDPEQVQFAYDLIADSMFNAVRFGGAPCSGLPWRWGFGYPGCIPGLYVNSR